MLKFSLKKQWLHFTEGWITDYNLLIEDEPDVTPSVVPAQALESTFLTAVTSIGIKRRKYTTVWWKYIGELWMLYHTSFALNLYLK